MATVHSSPESCGELLHLIEVFHIDFCNLSYFDLSIRKIYYKRLSRVHKDCR